MEEFIISDSDSEEESEGGGFDVYGADPVFQTREELNQFMASCNIQQGKKGSNLEPEEKIFFKEQKKNQKSCTCQKCEDIWSDEFQHICCHQIKRYELYSYIYLKTRKTQGDFC